MASFCSVPLPVLNEFIRRPTEACQRGIGLAHSTKQTAVQLIALHQAAQRALAVQQRVAQAVHSRNRGQQPVVDGRIVHEPAKRAVGIIEAAQRALQLSGSVHHALVECLVGEQLAHGAFAVRQSARDAPHIVHGATGAVQHRAAARQEQLEIHGHISFDRVTFLQHNGAGRAGREVDVFVAQQSLGAQECLRVVADLTLDLLGDLRARASNSQHRLYARPE